jgi:hypothetical protein
MNQVSFVPGAEKSSTSAEKGHVSRVTVEKVQSALEWNRIAIYSVCTVSGLYAVRKGGNHDVKASVRPESA